MFLKDILSILKDIIKFFKYIKTLIYDVYCIMFYNSSTHIIMKKMEYIMNFKKLLIYI